MAPPADRSVSKSVFKARALELCREVEANGRPLLITDHGRPVLRLVPYEESTKEILGRLRGSVTRYDDPTEPIDATWEAQE